MATEHPQNPPGDQGRPASGPGPAAQEASGFFAALFDIRFHTLITPKIVTIVYAASIVLGVLYFVVVLIAGFVQDPVLGLLVLVLGPIVFVIWLAFVRMTLEVYFSVVRMADDVHRAFGPDQRPSSGRTP